jgi:hypothetical protein
MRVGTVREQRKQVAGEGRVLRQSERVHVAPRRRPVCWPGGRSGTHAQHFDDVSQNNLWTEDIVDENCAWSMPPKF